MDLDEWSRVVRQVGPSRFKAIAVAFLQEQFSRPVDYKDGTGDSGVDAWVVLSQEPLVRRAVQMHAGEADWATKLEEDVQKLVALRGKVAPERLPDTKNLYFVCAHSPSALKFERLAEDMRTQHDVVVRLFDARSIAAQALVKGRVFELLARELPGWSAARGRKLDIRDETLLAFSLFHEAPRKFRWAVGKASVASVLEQDGGRCAEASLVTKAGRVLGLGDTSTLVVRSLRNLEKERLVTREDESVVATEALTERTRATLALAEQDRGKLVRECADALEPAFPKGTHGRRNRANVLAESVAMELGALVRASASGAVATAVGAAAGESESRAARLRDVLDGELDVTHVEATLAKLIELAAAAPFARRLAEAELFLQLTNVEAAELAQVLGAEKLRVWLDASIAMPVLCAEYDRVAPRWPTSVAAGALYGALSSRGAEIVVPNVYLEEIGVHLRKANDFAEAIGMAPALARSKNYFVAHFCSTRAVGEASPEAFRAFVASLGGAPSARLDEREQQAMVEQALGKVLRRYGIHVAVVEDRGADAPLAEEPPRPEIVLRHNRAVVRALSNQAQGTVLCTADTWLQSACADRQIVALDSAALADLVELARPAAEHRSLVSPVTLASIFGDDPRDAAAAVWDAVVAVERNKLDREHVTMAKRFLDDWIARGRLNQESPEEAWRAFRDREPVEGATHPRG